MPPLTEYRMHFERISPEEQAIDPDKSGERSKLGGLPDWDQENETPHCPDCDREMTFIAQIDSIHHDSQTNPHRIPCLSDDQEFMFGDVGMIYVFFCFDCCQTSSTFQCA